MTYLGVDDARVSLIGEVYFVGPGSLFSKVALRTVETELDSPAVRVPDLNALRFAREEKAGKIVPAHMVVVHESCARDLLAALAARAEFLPKRRLAIAFEREDEVCTRFADVCETLLEHHVSLLPMNTNVTNWVRLLQVIQAGGHYLPPDMLVATARGGSPAQPGSDAVPPGADPSERMHQDALTPREAEVLAMAADGRPNKTIASALDLSEHTVKLYMHRIIGKLGVTNRTEAAVWYHQHGSHG